MRTAIGCFLALAGLTALAVARPPEMVTTKIVLEELHCKGCAKQIARQLGEVPGVAAVRADLKQATLFVTHQPGKNPSPRAMWDAVEKTDHTPVRLEGPSGTYTGKPGA